MRIHTYTAGNHAAVTHPDVAPDVPLREAISLDITAENVAYVVGDRTVIDVRETAEAIFVRDSTGVIVHPCAVIKTLVTYSGREVTLDEHPADTGATVRKDAINKLTIAGADAVDLVLRLTGSADDLSAAAPIGAYTSPGTCGLSLELIHKHRPQG